MYYFFKTRTEESNACKDLRFGTDEKKTQTCWILLLSCLPLDIHIIE